MAKRLIDANALISELVKLQYSEQTMGIMHSQYPHFQAIVGRQPTVDAVEVVRCYQCIYSRKLNRKRQKEKEFTSKCIWCSYYETGKLPNDFCSDGERKDGGQAPQREDA